MNVRHYFLLTQVLYLMLGLALNGQNEKPADFSDRISIDERLEAARTELDALPESEEPMIRESLQRLEAACQHHLATIDFLTNAQNDVKNAELEATTWNGFPEPPPYSILLLDEIRESLAILDNSRRTNEAQIRIFKAEVESLGDDLTNQRQKERRFLEAAENSRDPEALQRARLSAKVESLTARITAERIGRRQRSIATENAKLAAIALRMELAQRKIAAINGEVVFTSEELERIQKEIAAERSAVSQNLVIESRKQLAPDPLLNWKIEFLDLRKAFWNIRFGAINSGDNTKEQEAIRELQALRNRVEDWMEIARLRITGGDAETANADPRLLRDTVLQLRETQRLLEFAINDLKGSGLKNRSNSLWEKIKSTLVRIWNAELYLVEESDIVDGRKILIYRAVTVGKLVHLGLILIFGWFVLRFLSRRIRVLVARRESVPQATADLAGKWAFGLGLALLICYGLQRVSIPLTVFAFLGGALAIGIGFGTQTLLKNFISGIILIFERPLKIGDVIEVAGITGTIKFIGIRASVIQHFDGIETLVPNSILLENQLTNWSFSNTVIRHSISVGVAYGSPTREVSRLLLAIAAEHGLVVKDPAPEVRFEDFGDNALTFHLLFWFDTRRTPRATLASDLRYMIEKAFAEAGIRISFPQRDLHFDTDSPLRVELSRAAKREQSKTSQPII